MRTEAIAERIWYGGSRLALLLLPLSWLFGAVTALRRLAYRRDWLHSVRAPVPVIVVGNITVGGVGKTPVVIALVEMLRGEGMRPGVVSRGYGGRQRVPRLIGKDDPAALVGDEPALILRRTGCPVAVGADRARACQLLIDEGVDVIVSDDGLQHYAMVRDVEIAVLDGERRLGNEWLLPAGPLREPAGRLQSVDLVLVNGPALTNREFSLQPQIQDAVRLADGERRPLADFRGGPVHAVAGIGNPERFFIDLERHGLDIERHAFSDHHPYSESDFGFARGAPVLMTEKDAVKCAGFTGPDIWVVPLSLEFPMAIRTRVLALLHSR